MPTIPANRKICRKSEQIARCRNGKPEQGPQRAPGTFADDFLRYQFLPLYAPSGNLPIREKAEKAFFRSLFRLSAYYGFNPIDVSGMPYPYNILLAHWDAKRQLNRGNQETEVFIAKDKQGRIDLITKKTYNAAGTLYYIPVIPLFRLLQKRHQKSCAELLMSVFSYLHRIARVPYFGDHSTTLYYYYDMVKEWFIEDLESWEEPDRNRNISEINEAEYYSNLMLRKIRSSYHLEHFKERMDKFRPMNGFQRDCFRLAKTAYELFQQYPDRTIFGHVIRKEEETEERIGLTEQYISFIADNQGWLFESIVQMVDDDLGECEDVEEPTIVRVFGDDSVEPDDDLDFEQRFFPLISDLCTLLNQIP